MGGAGAVFGLTGGWERGLWYSHDPAERDLPYAVTSPQPWQAIAVREAAEMAAGTVAIDLTPFGKFDISGRQALAALSRLCTANLDVRVGRAVYTQLLNAKGGIEADVTITRLGMDTFRITSSAPTRWRDGAYLRRCLGKADASLRDVTEDYAVIGVMGAGARDLLGASSLDDWAEFPFSHAREAVIAGVPCLATRLSFVGELGWEVTIPATDAGAVFDAVIGAGARPMGHYAVDACRIEKGYRHWGHDLGPEITPLEAGLGFTIDWSKDFIGKDALVAERTHGLSRRLCLFAIEGRALVLHDEPIWEEGAVVGLTTSGGQGARTGLTLALGLVTRGADQSLDQIAARTFEIEIAGRRYPARVLTRPPYDPTGERMRA